MGIIGWSLIGLGGECSGIVRAIGPKVKHIKVGDRVATLANWTFATRVFALEEVCIKIPDSLGFEDAATMFAVFCTVVHSLVNLGGIENGSVSKPGTSGCSNFLTHPPDCPYPLGLWRSRTGRHTIVPAFWRRGTSIIPYQRIRNANIVTLGICDSRECAETSSSSVGLRNIAYENFQLSRRFVLPSSHESDGWKRR